MAQMRGYGQFGGGSALEVLGERWTLLVVRELLLGSTTFTEIRRGLPRIPRATRFLAPPRPPRGWHHRQCRR